jgi:molybdopterin-guanine dinucleotide biosynthesis protein MobB
LKRTVIAVVGTKKSGKTATIETLIRELSRRGYKVAAIKHVPEPNHTIDTPGKDTWRYASAGAITVVSAAANEIATIEKVPLETVSIDNLVKRCTGNDVVFIEGFKKRVAKRKNVWKIVVVETADEVNNAFGAYEPIIAFSGSYSTEKLTSKIPYANALEKPGKLADIIEATRLKSDKSRTR